MTSLTNFEGHTIRPGLLILTGRSTKVHRAVEMEHNGKTLLMTACRLKIDEYTLLVDSTTAVQPAHCAICLRSKQRNTLKPRRYKFPNR